MSGIRTTTLLPGTVPNPTVTPPTTPATSIPQVATVDGYQAPPAATVDMGTGNAGGRMSVFSAPAGPRVSIPAPRTGIWSQVQRAEALTEIILRHESHIKSDGDTLVYLEGDCSKAREDYAALVQAWPVNSAMVREEAERVRGLFAQDKAKLEDCVAHAYYAHIVYGAYEKIIGRLSKNSSEAYSEMTALGQMLADPAVGWKAAQALSNFFPGSISVVTDSVMDVADHLFQAIESPQASDGFRFYAGFAYGKIFSILSEPQKRSEIERIKILLEHPDDYVRYVAHNMFRLFYYEKSTLSRVAEYVLTKVKEGCYRDFFWTYNDLIERFAVGSSEVLDGVDCFRECPESDKSVYISLVKKLPDGHEELAHAAERGRADIVSSEDTTLYTAVMPKMNAALRRREIEAWGAIWRGAVPNATDKRKTTLPMTVYQQMILECGDEGVIRGELPHIREIMIKYPEVDFAYSLYQKLIELFPEEVFFEEVKKLKAILKKQRSDPYTKDSFNRSLRDRLSLLVHRRRYGEGDDRLFERYRANYPADQNNVKRLSSALEERIVKARKNSEETFDLNINLETGEVTLGILSGSTKISFVNEYGFYHLSLESARVVRDLLGEATNTSSPLAPGAYRQLPQDIAEKKLGSLLGILGAIEKDAENNKISVLDAVDDEVEPEVVSVEQQTAASRVSLSLVWSVMIWVLTLGRKGQSPLQAPQLPAQLQAADEPAGEQVGVISDSVVQVTEETPVTRVRVANNPDPEVVTSDDSDVEDVVDHSDGKVARKAGG